MRPRSRFRWLAVVAAVVACALVILGLQTTASAQSETISVSPASGPPGTAVTVSGQGYSDPTFTSGVEIDISINHGNGYWEVLATGVADPKPDANGNFAVKVTIPANAPPGADLAISGLNGSGASPFASFTVTGAPASPTPSPTFSPAVTYSPSSGPVGTSFTITGSGWMPGGTVTSTLPYGSPGWFTGYQTPTVDSNGHFLYKETVGTGPHGPTPPGAYTITYAENYHGTSLSASQTFTVTPSPAPSPTTTSPSPSPTTPTPSPPPTPPVPPNPNGNWDGYAVSYAERYTNVTATWTEPQYPGNGIASFWVGLGGQNGPPLLQIGTVVGKDKTILNGKTPTYWAFYQKVTDNPSQPTLINKPVAPGDTFTASVTYGGQGYTLKLTDTPKKGKGWTFTTVIHQGYGTDSAEVVMESPNGTTLPKVLSPVEFSGIKVNGAPMQNPTPDIIPPNVSKSSANVSSYNNNSFTAYPWK